MMKLKPKYFCGTKEKYTYDIFYSNNCVGYITFLIKKRILILAFITIYEDYQRQGLGYKTIEYLISHYKIKCIVGETLEESRGFWSHCIKKFNGMRKNVVYCDNCTSSFIIPKQKITQEFMFDMLKIAYQIV